MKTRSLLSRRVSVDRGRFGPLPRLRSVVHLRHSRKGYPLRYAALVLGAVLMLPGCSRSVTTVRTVTPDEYAALSWIGHTAEEVALAWGENRGGEPDGAGGWVLTYRRVQTTSAGPQSASGVPLWASGYPILSGPNAILPNAVVAIDDLAKFWIGSDGKVYRYWFADEVFRKHLDAPGAGPVKTHVR